MLKQILNLFDDEEENEDTLLAICKMFELFQTKGNQSLLVDFYAKNSISIKYVKLINLMKGDDYYVE